MSRARTALSLIMCTKYKIFFFFAKKIWYVSPLANLAPMMTVHIVALHLFLCDPTLITFYDLSLSFSLNKTKQNKKANQNEWW